MNTTVTLPSAKELEIQIAPFAIAAKLYKVLARELITVDVSIGSTSLEEFLAKDISEMKNIFCVVLASDPFEAALFDCMKSCLYDQIKISKATFESEEARADFFLVCWEVAKANLLPFFANLKSLLPTRTAKAEPGPTS